jgi:hypothetical protein
MKKLVIAVMVVSLAIVGSAFAGQKVSSSYTLDSFTKKVDTADMKIVLNGNSLELSNVRIVPQGDNPNHDSWLATTVRIESGMADADTKQSVVVNASVAPGSKVIIPLLAFGKKFQEPVVEHFYGRGDAPGKKDLPIRLNPDNPWVCYKLNKDGSPDLQTLFIGVVSNPDGSISKLKTVLKKRGDTEFYVPQGVLASN